MIKLLIRKTLKKTNTRGIWFGDDRMDFYEIHNEPVKKNAGCVAAILNKDTLIEEKNGFSTIKIKNYGKTFNMCENEPFHDQPIAAGHVFTGCLVGADIIATAGHVVHRDNIQDLRIVFGFKMEGPYKPIIRVPNEYIYKGVEISQRVYRSMSVGVDDWALVKLDRKAVGHRIAKLSRKVIFSDQPIYVLGHPMGLPLKYAPGANVSEVGETYFGANLDVYSGNIGSPVFRSDTHEVIGMVVRTNNRDFRYTGNCWLTVVYPHPHLKSSSIGATCTSVSEFIEYIRFP